MPTFSFKAGLRSRINKVSFMHPSMSSPREGGRANHGSLIVRSVPRVGILIVCDVPRLAILIVQRTFYHLHLPPGGHFDQLFCPWGGEFEFFLMEMSKSPPSLGLNIDRCIISQCKSVFC